MHWRRKWQPTPAFLPGESQGWESGGLPSMVSHRVGHDWRDLAAAAALKLIGFVFLVYRSELHQSHTHRYTYALKPETCLLLALNFKEESNINIAVEGENSFSTQRTQMQSTESWNSIRNYSIQWGISQFSRSVMSNSLQPHESQYTRSPCLSPTPGVYSNSRQIGRASCRERV